MRPDVALSPGDRHIRSPPDQNMGKASPHGRPPPHPSASRSDRGRGGHGGPWSIHGLAPVRGHHDGMEMDRTGFADFLRRSRQRRRPESAGLFAGANRRTPGLRREEVALLAGMSADVYMRYEQARGPRPSIQVLSALARALGLTEDERDRLHLLAGYRPPAGRRAAGRVRPGLSHLLDLLDDVPARIVGGLGDVLAQNQPADLLFGDADGVREQDRNIVWHWFTDPDCRTAYTATEQSFHSRDHVAWLRAAAARRPGDPAASTLVSRLRSASREFAHLWDRAGAVSPGTDDPAAGAGPAGLGTVPLGDGGRVRIVHPAVGLVELNRETLLAPAEHQRLLIFTARPGTPSAARLRLLLVSGGDARVANAVLAGIGPAAP